MWGGQNLLAEAVRMLVRAGRRDDAAGLRDRLAALAVRSVPAAAFLAWANGLLEDDAAAARERLAHAAARLERLGRRVDLARCLVDLAAAERRLGADPEPTLTRARRLLEASGAPAFVREVDAATAEGV